MGFYVSPGVYVREKDLSNLIPNISTTSAALVGYSTKGSTAQMMLITNSQQLIQEYGYPVPGTFLHYTGLAYLENGNKLYCLRVHNGALFGGLKIMKSGSGPNLTMVTGKAANTFQLVSGEDILFYIFGRDQGTWNNSTGIRITNVDAVAYTFDIEVYALDADGNYQKVETWTVSRKHQIDGYGKQQNLTDVINGYSAYITVTDNLIEADTVLPEAQPTTLALGGGSNGGAVGDSELVLGWDKFSNPDDVDIRILLNGGYTTVPVQQKIKTIAESRKDCIGILDMPYAQAIGTVLDMTNWRTITQNFNTSYVALYSPWVKMYDPYNDKVLDIPPSGYIGSQIAYNDFVAEPWYAPAGFNRGMLNVLGMAGKIFTQGERDVLCEKQINPLQTFRGEGNVIWGQKTEQVKASALDRVNVRRLLIVIEKAISASLKYFVFEPNSDITRYRITNMIEEYLTLLAARGAFQTEGGDKGFKVLCDRTNNTPAIIDRNELHVDIFLKPSRAAEFIQLQAIITQTGASFEELIARGVMF
jgi:phage tail sheath protein FI